MKRLIYSVLILLAFLSLACGCNTEIDDPLKGSSDTEIPEEPPKPFTVYLDNGAGWGAVYCIAFTKDETEGHTQALMNVDAFGIYYAELPGECDRIVFLNGEGEQTEILPIPGIAKSTYDNSAESWITYEDAIANSLSLGDNPICVTSAHKIKGGEYVLFYAENDGVYSFTSDSGFDIKVVSTELNNGNWDKDSTDWTKFFTTGNTVELNAGYYYVLLDSSDDSVSVGLHNVHVEYRRSEPQSYPLINCIFSDGEITVVFLQNNGYRMKVMDFLGNDYVYYYTASETDDGYLLNLTPAEGSEEYNVNGYFLSELCGVGNVFVLNGDLYFHKRKIPSLAD